MDDRAEAAKDPPDSPVPEAPGVKGLTTLGATRRALEQDFDHLRAELESAARRAGNELSAATVVEVPRKMAARYADGGPFSSLFDLLGAGAGVFALQDDLPLTMLLQAQTRPLPPTAPRSRSCSRTPWPSTCRPGSTPTCSRPTGTPGPSKRPASTRPTGTPRSAPTTTARRSSRSTSAVAG